MSGLALRRRDSGSGGTVNCGATRGIFLRLFKGIGGSGDCFGRVGLSRSGKIEDLLVGSWEEVFCCVCCCC